MSTPVQRYEDDEMGYMSGGVMKLDPRGTWVRYTDYESLAAQLALVTAERDLALDELWGLNQ